MLDKPSESLTCPCLIMFLILSKLVFGKSERHIRVGLLEDESFRHQLLYFDIQSFLNLEVRFFPEVRSCKTTLCVWQAFALAYNNLTFG